MSDLVWNGWAGAGKWHMLNLQSSKNDDAYGEEDEEDLFYAYSDFWGDEDPDFYEEDPDDWED